jgi:hypothetical protein
MRIFIDEAGNFVPPPDGQSLFSLVLALVIPTSVESEILQAFLRLRDGWPNNAVEIKGSKLDEAQAAELIELVSRYDVFVKFFAVDMTTHGDGVVGPFKDRQADAITAHLTPDHHPPVVAQLEGLANAIRRMPNQLFGSHDLPNPIPPDISLSLFRVLQEALHNAAKHSGAKQFEVQLWGMPDEIHLTISDSGTGFDPEAATKGPGLGLISMQERINLVGGTFSVDSRCDRGTTIHACVPLKRVGSSMSAAG